MAQLTKERVDEMKERNHLRYAAVAGDKNVLRAMRRITELQPLQSDRSLLNTDNRIEYTALMGIIHDLCWGHKISQSKFALSIWLDNREFALDLVTFGDEAPAQLTTADQEKSFSALVRAKLEADARDLDQHTIEAALRMLAEGTLEQHAVFVEQSEQAKEFIRRNTPPDVKAIVRAHMAETVEATV